MLIEYRDRKLLHAIALYQRYRGQRDLPSRFKCALGKLGHIYWSLLSASDISRDAKIDLSTRMPHPTGVVIHADAVVEPGCMIMQQVTIGQLASGGVPVIERGVYLGSGSKILGPVRVGAGARIGANAVVLDDIPPNSTAVGVPARVVSRRGDPATTSEIVGE
ncbi:MAG: hypothetical protein LC137_15275 [Burkholderiales bacterium]|nr:hypothetical protein [Burkholderiales bacterium]